MPTSSTSLPDDVEALRGIIAKQQAQLEHKSDRISVLEEYIRLLKRQRFGSSSEQAPIDQLGLFNEAEATDGALTVMTVVPDMVTGIDYRYAIRGETGGSEKYDMREIVAEALTRLNQIFAK